MSKPSRKEKKAGKGIFRELLRGKYDAFEEMVGQMSDDALWEQMTKLEDVIAKRPKPMMLKMQDIMLKEINRRQADGS